MSKKIAKQIFRIDVDQWSTLQVLSCYGVNISAFIRAAIKEKIHRDWKEIRAKKERIKTPF
jgi:post-segregation antitoxin (ccd killing protein)